MSSSYEKEAIPSDEDLKAREEDIAKTVTRAMADRPISTVAVPEHQPTDVWEAEELATDREDTTDQTGSDVSYVGELLVDRQVAPIDAFQLCQDLKSTIKSEIISIAHSDAGTMIKCRVPNPASLLSALGQLSGISSWTLVPEEL